MSWNEMLQRGLDSEFQGKLTPDETRAVQALRSVEVPQHLLGQTLRQLTKEESVLLAELNTFFPLPIPIDPGIIIKAMPCDGILATLGMPRMVVKLALETAKQSGALTNRAQCIEALSKDLSGAVLAGVPLHVLAWLKPLLDEIGPRLRECLCEEAGL